MSNVTVFNPRIDLATVRRLSEHIAAEVAPQLEIVGAIPAEDAGDACEVLARDHRGTSLVVFRLSRRRPEHDVRANLRAQFWSYSKKAYPPS